MTSKIDFTPLYKNGGASPLEARDFMRVQMPIGAADRPEHKDYEFLRETTNRAEIEEAVNSDNEIKNQYVARNSLITAEDCAILARKLDYELDLLIFLFNPLIPSEALDELAVRQTKSRIVLGCIEMHPNLVSEKTKTIIALCLKAPRDTFPL